VAPTTRTITAVAGALVAAFTLTGCNANGSNVYTSVGGDTSKAPAASGEDAAVPEAPKPAGIVTTTLIAKKVPRMGNVVTDAKGWILYRFDRDTSDPSSSGCVNNCAKVWLPVLTDGVPKLKGIDESEVGSLMRDDGGIQVTIGGWPVYRYIGDLKPGKWKGQNVAGTWFVVSKNGKKNLTCLPPVSKAVKPPAAADKADDSAVETQTPAPAASDTGTGGDGDTGGFSSGY
jgi:predicted lipoprotein with Yx(FWY)xxD motif